MEGRVLATPKATIDVLERHGFRPTKRLGQHFLVDANTVAKIIGAADLEESDVVLEIGPGIGTLTVAVAPRVSAVVAVEKDRRLIPILDETLEGLGNVKVVPVDALAFDAARLPAGIPIPNKCVSNLPYQIATPIIADYIELFPNIILYVVMVQKEVGDRMLAKPGGKDYGAFSVKLQYFCEIDRVMNVSKHVFIPKPEVDSTVVRLRRRERPPVEVDDRSRFFKVVRAAFAQRRKTLKRALSAGLSLTSTDVTAALEQAGINPQRRGETLTIEEFAAVANELVG